MMYINCVYINYVSYCVKDIRTIFVLNIFNNKPKMDKYTV